MKLPIIEVHHISKKYQIMHEGKRRLLRNDLEHLARRYFATLLKLKKRSSAQTPYAEDFWPLRDITFAVKQGESIGIIGANGAGKSTLLRIIAGIIEPTSGEIRVRGRCGSLLEIGAGFHPELTGRENIYLSGAILGIPKKTIQRKFAEILEFSGVKKFIDTPIKYFSSGMYVRLAFSVAVQLEPEILLIDEVFAVGDVEFQKKSLKKMEEISRKKNQTIVAVSHNMEIVKQLFDRVVHIEHGRIVRDGKAQEVVEAYLARINTKA